MQVNEVLTEVSLIKDRQEDIDGKLDTMKNENEALWREVREKLMLLMTVTLILIMMMTLMLTLMY